ncbi:hypothetical protein ACSV9I_05960 [Rhizobium sp. G187]|uniref:hypothetical protein n=1 Tax=unclassified Rhizobium TaxID=2613769 RepID=UPI0006B9C1FB|nr:hypothetical protein [Rhizobium sp. AAP43]KPF45666.1 hypothetical protein IP76_07365 [Rhizobium sp. AAP43]
MIDIYLFVSALIMAMLALATWSNIYIAPDRSTLPMQWSLRGRINWQAPRMVALFSPPLVLAVIMTLVALFASEQNDFDKALVFRALMFMAVLGLALQLLHIWLIARGVGDDGDQNF